MKIKKISAVGFRLQFGGEDLEPTKILPLLESTILQATYAAKCGKISVQKSSTRELFLSHFLHTTPEKKNEKSQREIIGNMPQAISYLFQENTLLYSKIFHLKSSLCTRNKG